MTFVDLEVWPETGRVGFCHSGEAAGRYVFLHVAVERTPENDAYWQAFFSPALSTGEDEFFVDDRSGVIQEFFAQSDVEWAPVELDLALEDATMGLRRRFQTAGSATYVGISDLIDKQIEVQKGTHRPNAVWPTARGETSKP